VPALIEAGAVAGKLYPAGVTTGSADGVADVHAVFPHLEIMQQHDSVLSIHGEDPDSFCLDRERQYLKQVQEIRDAFPKLRIVLEHLSDRASVGFIQNSDAHMAATITVHHLLLTLDDVIGGNINPHHFCKPVAKSSADRDALRRAAFSGNPKFFLGTDSAPHLKAKKESSSGIAGIYTSPVAIPLLAGIFDQAGVRDRLQGFCSENGSRFYGLPLNQETIVLQKKEWEVPAVMHGAVPFYAGRKISWSLANCG
jgi:dihydroorotase